MKKSPFIPFLTVLALIAAVFSGCGDVDLDGAKSTKAELKSLRVGGLETHIPAAITRSVWDDKNTRLGELAAEYTATIEFPLDADMSGLTVTALASEKAKAEFNTANSSSVKPNTNTYKTANNNTVTLSPNRYLYIRVSAEDESYLNYYRFYITKETVVVRVEGISLTGNAARGLTIGQSEKLEYTITPEDATNQAVSWSSSAPAVASVTADGTVTAEGVGDAVITVTTADGSFSDSVTVTVTPPVSVSGISLEKSSVTLTIHSSEKLTFTLQPPNATNKNVTWSSSNTAVATVAQDGTVTAVNFTSGGTTRFSNGGTSTSPNTYPATGTATITAKTVDGGHEATITVTATTAAQVGIMDLPPLKDKFANYFMIGNIARSSGDITGSGTSASISQARLTRHYNILTSENNMKPQNMTNARNTSTGAITYTWTNADNFVNAAENAGLQVVGHALLWHSQNPNWVWDQIASKTGTAVSGMTKANAITIMKQYITAVVSRYAGRIYSWDVLNEAFPDNAGASADWKTAIRKAASGEGQDANPWYVAIGSDFVYEGFLAARLADPNAILYYNDYNTDVVNRARLIRDMVQEVNNKYLALASSEKPAGEAPGRLLIEGIGMQEHHNNGITAAKIRATIDTFRPLGVRLSVTELDIIAVPQYNDLGGSGADNNQNAANVTNNTLMDQARLYGEYMQVYLDNADIIERVSLWGVTDNTSWRSRGLPLLFDHAAKAKPAYYRFVKALDEWEAIQP